MTTLIIITGSMQSKWSRKKLIGCLSMKKRSFFVYQFFCFASLKHILFYFYCIQFTQDYNLCLWCSVFPICRYLEYSKMSHYWVVLALLNKLNCFQYTKIYNLKPCLLTQYVCCHPRMNNTLLSQCNLSKKEKNCYLNFILFINKYSLFIERINCQLFF